MNEYFSLRAPGPELLTSDGVRLHVEIDEPAEPSTEPTIVLIHGYILSLHCWHHQRLYFRSTGRRIVLYDQRGHGRSEGGLPETCQQPRLAEDLLQVLEETTAPDEKVFLIGHSMGGMTIQQLAMDHPELFGTKVVATAFLSSTPGGLEQHSVVKHVPGKMFMSAAQLVCGLQRRAPENTENVRTFAWGLSTRAVRWLTKYVCFGEHASQADCDFCSDMLAGIPLSVLVDYVPGLREFDGTPSFPVLGRVPTMVLGCAQDGILPVDHSRALAAGIPGAKWVFLNKAGHMGFIEAPFEVNSALERLLEQVRLGTRPR